VHRNPRPSNAHADRFLCSHREPGPPLEHSAGPAIVYSAARRIQGQPVRDGGRVVQVKELLTLNARVHKDHPMPSPSVLQNRINEERRHRSDSKNNRGLLGERVG
jgi:hypothetical protein